MKVNDLKKKPEMKALILAAGRGRRLMPFTRDLPKCLVEVGGKPILYYQLTALAGSGIRTVCIVVGYRAEQIKNFVAKNFPRLDVVFLHNNNYERTNDSYSFVLAKEFCNGDFIHMDSDVLFHPAVLSKLLATPPGANATCVRRAACGEEEMKVMVDEQGFVRRMGKWIDPASATGECMGISLFRSGASEELFQKAHEIGVESKWAAYCNDAMDKIMTQSSRPFYGIDITDLPVIEIDFPEDLKRAYVEILPNINSAFSSIV